MTAAGLSALLWDFLFIPPLYTFSIGRLEDQLMLMTYFLVALITGVLSTRSRAQELAVRIREQHASALFALTKELTLATTREQVLRTGIDHIEKFFNADVAVYLGQTDGKLPPHPTITSGFGIEERDLEIAHWVFTNETPAGNHSETMAVSSSTFYPLSGPRYTLGVIGVHLRTGERLPAEMVDLLENFIRQISSALDREILHEATRAVMVVQESERLYKTLFNSLSHELRTPIASIIGAAEGLQQPEVTSRHGVREEFARQILRAARRLNRLVENLLNMTRLESGMLTPALDWTDIQDLIRTTLSSMDEELSGRTVTLTVAANVPLLQLDFGLMEQVLVNLLHNITQYTPDGSPIEISANVVDQCCLIAITDHGAGIPKEALPRIFDKFYRSPGTKAGGTGLGLSIARGFVEAHHGKLGADLATEGGTTFSIMLPLPPDPAPAPQEERMTLP